MFISVTKSTPFICLEISNFHVFLALSEVIETRIYSEEKLGPRDSHLVNLLRCQRGSLDVVVA